MAEGFGRWESDPLFSAAEVVQDSADRMESVFRMLSHDQCLAQRSPSDSKLLGLTNFHRRDLMTSLETTKWQLEDFERAVNFAASCDESNSRESAISNHKQFIRAIREQIIQFEKFMENTSTDHSNRNSQWMNSNEQETDGLALFLSGGNSGNNIMGRFLDSTMDSDEIVELNSEDVEHFPMSNLKHSNIGNGSSKVSRFSKSFDIEAPALFPSGPKVHEELYTNSGAKLYYYRNILMDYIRGLKFWLSNENKGSFTKRRKDGEVTSKFVDDDVQMLLSSSVNMPAAEQDKHVSKCWATVYRICEKINLKRSINVVRPYTWLQFIRKRIRISQYLRLYNRFSRRLTSAALVVLIVLGVIVFCLA